MTKSKVFIIQYNPIAANHDLFRDFWKAVDTGKKNIQPKNLMVVDSIETAYKIMTEPRMEIFYALTEKRPDSINQLASILDKDYANVWRDCQVLANLGVIKLQKVVQLAKPEQIKPIALYQRIVFDFPSKELLDKKPLADVPLL